jgi:large subunit ribosomal protein L4
MDVPVVTKTAEMAKFLADNKFERKTLLVVTEKTPELIRATANLQNVLLIRATYLSVYYILNADHIVMTPAALEAVKGWLTKEEA